MRQSLRSCAVKSVHSFWIWAFDLGRGSCGSPEKILGELQQISVACWHGLLDRRWSEKTFRENNSRKLLASCDKICAAFRSREASGVRGIPPLSYAVGGPIAGGNTPHSRRVARCRSRPRAVRLNGNILLFQIEQGRLLKPHSVNSPFEGVAAAAHQRDSARLGISRYPAAPATPGGGPG